MWDVGMISPELMVTETKLNHNPTRGGLGGRRAERADKPTMQDRQTPGSALLI